ncbi:MAG: hypothetical protein Q9195_008858 [Heterodermia aff. obscurata]
MFELFTFNAALLLLCTLLIYCLGLAFYRLYLDPLAKFPGPKLAALTLWYEFYYDVIKRGKYTFEIEKMHEAYGPIVRINPYELHISDPDFYDDLYVSGSVRKTNKYIWSARMFGNSSSMFGTLPHDLHRIRRGAMAPFLSKQSVQKLEPKVQLVIDKLTSRFDALRGSDTSINLIDAFSALTGDIIAQYAFAQTHGFIDSPDFSPWWHKAWMDVSENGYKFKHINWLEPTLRRMPLWAVRILNPQMVALIEMQDSLEKQVVEVKTDLQAGRKNTGQRTVFYDVLTNDNIRPEEKGTDHLKNEAQTFVAAGTVTTAHVLSTTTFYLIENPAMLEKLHQELRTVIKTDGQTPNWQQLEQLPYLTAVINEGLRIAYGIMHRLQRVSPDQAIQFKEWTIPPMVIQGSKTPFRTFSDLANK